jgi:hypothetical protein
MKSVYQHPTKDDNGSAYKEIWKAKNPLENKDLYVVSSSKAILTKDNMVGKNWKGDPSCYFCGGLKNIDYLLFSCPIAKVVWVWWLSVLDKESGQVLRRNSGHGSIKL